MDKQLFILFIKSLPMSKLIIFEAENEEDFFICVDLFDAYFFGKCGGG